MNALIIGAGQGSWTMRGQQLGAALGARVTSSPSDDDLVWADVAVLVKHAGLLWSERVRACGLPIVWDALDFWRQPAENGQTERQAREMLLRHIAQIQPSEVIGATESMAAAAGGVYLPHHSWSGLTPTPARATVRRVGYQGNAAYLGRWSGWLASACAQRGWDFFINPTDLSAVDILVTLRDGSWDGWMCREWKSGVKVVNAIAAGRPLISQDCAAVRELQPDGSVIDGPADLGAALDTWADASAREWVVTRALDRAPQFTVDAVSTLYHAQLEATSCPV